MKLATIRRPESTTAARMINDTHAIALGYPDVGVLLQNPDWHSLAKSTDGDAIEVTTSDFAPVVPRPGKIVCVGLNYRNHIQEMGRELPEFPTLFAKYPEALIGAYDDIVLPAVASNAIDWEAELAVVIGKQVRHATADSARNAIAGYSVINDVTARDYQYRSPQWLQGKTFESTTPFGPVLVTSDEIDPSTLELRGELDGELVQQAKTGDLVFDAAALVRYISSILTLKPGDVIATGTPGGVGHARNPQRYLQPGSHLTTTISGIGELQNTAISERVQHV